MDQELLNPSNPVSPLAPDYVYPANKPWGSGVLVALTPVLVAAIALAVIGWWHRRKR